jgi:hypothetical protein
MNITVDNIDIHSFQLPGSTHTNVVTVLLVLAMSVYIIATVISLVRTTRTYKGGQPLLNQDGIVL